MKPGRNDPCPCGSGKKFKKCCHDKFETRLAALNVPTKKSTPTAAEINQLVVLLNVGRYAELESQSRLLIKQYPDAGIIWKALCISLQRQGKGALQALQKATELLPDDAEVHNNLGIALGGCGQLEAAVASFRRVLEIKPDDAEAHSNLGSALSGLGQLEAAVASFRRALEIKPDYAEAHSSLGRALMELGKMDEAERFLSKALKLSSGDARPLATALLYIPYQQNDPRFDQLETVYTRRESQPLEDRIDLNFAMGKAMENIGQYDRSFDAYEEGNRLYYQGHPFDEAADDRYLEESCRIFTPDLFQECATLTENLPAIRDERVPIFIVGMPRSGTTLIEQMLASHPAILGAGELTKLGELARKAEHLTLDLPTLSALRKLGQEYLDHVWKLAPDARYFTDKMPGNYRYLWLIHLMLPNAKIIHSLRDPMDTCFSCYALRFKLGHEYTYDLETLGRQYMRYRKLMKHWQNVLPSGRILDVRYEDNVADPEREARQMLDYLELPWNPACLRFYETERTVRTYSVAQVRKPIYSSSVGRWKHFEKHLEPLLETIHPAMAPASFASDD